MQKIDATNQIENLPASGSGDVVGPASATDGHLAVFDGTTGKLIKDGGAPSGGSGIPTDGWIDKTAETWTYASADSPTFTFTISGDLTATYQVGQRIKLTQTTVKYFIITAVVYSAPNTSVTIYGGTDYSLANAAISANYYSPVKAPFGFPTSPAKWTVTLTDTTQRTQASPVDNTFYNLGTLSLSIPIGLWDLSYQVVAQVSRGSANNNYGLVALSTANNSISDTGLKCSFASASTTVIRAQLNRQKLLSLAAKTTYYMIMASEANSAGNIYFMNDAVPLLVSCVCAYL
jgi:hypothetical protein